MRLFISGIIQGSIQEMAIHGQGYRDEIAAAVREVHPELEIVDPVKLHPNSVTYDRKRAIDTFLQILDRAAAADVIVAYLPEASMGTALEIWRAYEAGKPVFVISPMVNNWTLWATTTRTFPDIAAFARFVADGELAPYLSRPTGSHPAP